MRLDKWLNWGNIVHCFNELLIAMNPNELVMPLCTTLIVCWPRNVPVNVQFLDLYVFCYYVLCELVYEFLWMN